jgi:DNA-binding transcriptional MerR regulator
VPTPTPETTATLDRPEETLLRIQEVADETGLTTRAVRYYEEIGLLAPAARSEGAYRLYDGEDLRRLRFIKGLREDAGFSLAEIRQLLEDEAARTQIRARFRATADPAERRQLLLTSMAQVDRQIESLQEKIGRLTTMIDEARARRERLQAHLEANETGRELPAHDSGTSAR